MITGNVRRGRNSGSSYSIKASEDELSVMAGLTDNVENEGNNCRDGIDGRIVLS